MENTNIIQALINMIENNNNELLEEYEKYSDNRANSMGDALEYYVKDAFCNAFNMEFSEKDKQYSKYLSYLGNSKNPPDFIVKNSFAVEVKKLEWKNNSFSSIALNSSYPKDILHSNSTLLSRACKECEDELWNTKKMYYAIGSIQDKKRIKVLWLVDGECYCATKETYERIKLLIKDGVNEIDGVEFAQSKELGKVKKVDPLGVTDLRIRGMWNIEHPRRTFDYLFSNKDDITTDFNIYCLMLKEKYDVIEEELKKKLLEYKEKVRVNDVEVKNPNNPAKYMKAKFIEINLN